MKRLSVFSVIVVLVLMASACAPAAPPPAPTAPPAAPAAPAAPVAPAAPAATAVPTAVPPTAVPPTPTVAAPTPVAQVPADKLGQKGHLLICTDFPYPPQEMFDDNGNPIGMDIDIGTEIASRLGLKVQFVNSVFDTIIQAVAAGKCDIIISAQNITVERQKQVSMIPYFKAGQSLVVVKGNPEGIKEPMDLCGKGAAAESGTTEADYLQGTGDYKDNGLTQACVKAGKQPVNTIVTQKDSDAFQQLLANKVAAYSTDSPVAGYYTLQHGDKFEMAGNVFEAVQEGISVPCGEADCTGKPLSPVGQAVEAALKSMMSDGAYLKILTKWNLAGGSVAP